MNARKRASVIGSPISHSLSPAIFKIIAEHEGVGFDYGAQEVTVEKLAEFVLQLRNEPYVVGHNVTLPLKEAIIPYLDSVSDEAQTIGAVNVIHKMKDVLYGFNTDIAGIEKTFEIEKFDPKNKACFLFGAGGSAKATAYLLAKMSAAQVVVYNPRSDRGVLLCSQLKEKFLKTQFTAISSLKEAPTVNFALVVNATPLGMASDTSYFSNMRQLQFEKEALAFDLIYTPAVTPFIKEAKLLALKTVGGLSMLIEQAISTWELWIGSVSHRRELHDFLAGQLRGFLYFRSDSRPIFLTGFMGVGKSSAARELAEILGWKWVDTDQSIEARAGQSISEIFAQKGESHFRKIEKETIQWACTQNRSIVSLGGGALMNPQNLELIKKSGTLIYLEDSEKNLFNRLSKQQTSRPLLADLTQAEKYSKITNLLAERRPVYEKSHLTVSVQGHNSYSLAREIVERMGKIA